jgi:hypothetical protein
MGHATAPIGCVHTCQSPTTHHAAHLAQDRERIRNVLDGRIGEDCIEATVRELERFPLADREAQVGNPLRRRERTRRIDLRRLDVDANDFAGATARANPRVIEPGPQPTSSTRIPGCRCAKRNAPSRSAVRLSMWLTIDWL